MTLIYDDIYSSFLPYIATDGKIMSLTEQDAYIIFKGFLETALSQPYIRKVFATFECDDDMEQLNYTLNDSVADYDERFIKDILVRGMTIAWMNQNIDTKESLALVLGGKEEKMLKNDYKANVERVKALELRLKKEIRDHKYYLESFGNS